MRPCQRRPLEASSFYCTAIDGAIITVRLQKLKLLLAMDRGFAHQGVREFKLGLELGTIQPRLNAGGLQSPRIHDTRMQNSRPHPVLGVPSRHQPSHRRSSTNHPHGPSAESSDVASPANGWSAMIPPRRGRTFPGAAVLYCRLTHSILISREVRCSRFVPRFIHTKMRTLSRL